MATEYHLFIASDTDSESLLQIVEDSLGVDHFRDPEFRSEHNPSLVGRWALGIILTSSAQDQMGGEILEEWLHFRPTLRLGFRWDREWEDWPSMYRRVLRATSAVLANVSGDVALIANGERGLLIRRDGRVTVADRPNAFDAESLAEIRVPYEIGRVPTAADAP